MEELPVLQQVPVAIPQTRNHISWLHDNRLGREILRVLEDLCEPSIDDGEAHGRGLALVLCPDALVAVDRLPGLRG